MHAIVFSHVLSEFWRHRWFNYLDQWIFWCHHAWSWVLSPKGSEEDYPFTSLRIFQANEYKMIYDYYGLANRINYYCSLKKWLNTYCCCYCCFKDALHQLFKKDGKLVPQMSVFVQFMCVKCIKILKGYRLVSETKALYTL